VSCVTSVCVFSFLLFCGRWCANARTFRGSEGNHAYLRVYSLRHKNGEGVSTPEKKGNIAHASCMHVQFQHMHFSQRKHGDMDVTVNRAPIHITLDYILILRTRLAVGLASSHRSCCHHFSKRRWFAQSDAYIATCLAGSFRALAPAPCIVRRCFFLWYFFVKYVKYLRIIILRRRV
jgi:hypothetical protein